jgi:hypothetical protein
MVLVAHPLLLLFFSMTHCLLPLMAISALFNLAHVQEEGEKEEAGKEQQHQLLTTMGECDVVLALQRQYYETFANARSSDNMHHVINQSATLRRIPVVMVLEEKNSPVSSFSSLVTLERSFVQMKTKGRRGISSGGVGTVFPQVRLPPLFPSLLHCELLTTTLDYQPSSLTLTLIHHPCSPLPLLPTPLQFVHWPLSSLSEFGYLSGEEGWYSSSDYLMQECGDAMARRLRLKEAMQRGTWSILCVAVADIVTPWLTTCTSHALFLLLFLSTTH